MDDDSKLAELVAPNEEAPKKVTRKMAPKEEAPKKAARKMAPKEEAPKETSFDHFGHDVTKQLLMTQAEHHKKELAEKDQVIMNVHDKLLRSSEGPSD